MKKVIDHIDVRQSPNAGTENIVPLDVSRRFQCYLGFRREVMRPGNSMILCAQPQVPFRPKRLVVVVTPSTEADKVLLIDMKVGKNSMHLSAEGVSVSCFPPIPLDKVDEENIAKVEDALTIHGDVCNVNQLISLNFESWSASDVCIAAMLWGQMPNYDAPRGKEWT